MASPRKGPLIAWEAAVYLHLCLHPPHLMPRAASPSGPHGDWCCHCMWHSFSSESQSARSGKLGPAGQHGARKALGAALEGGPVRRQQHLELTFHLRGRLQKAWLRQRWAVWTLRVKAHASHAAGTVQGPGSDPWLFSHPRLQVQGTRARKAPLWADSEPAGTSVSSCGR